MARSLDVYLHNEMCGHLLQDKDGKLHFKYAESWLERLKPLALSHSLPLRKEGFGGKECHGFFGGILPEEAKREIIAKNLGISARNDFAMLEQIGGECAGAVTFLPEGTPLPKREDKYRAVSESELADILRKLPRRPLLAGDDGIRLSLAGAQDKIAVRVAGTEISIPLGGAPSTHILKPKIQHLEGTVYNEAFCLKLAKAIGLPAASVETRQAEELDYLLVERYDRRVVRPYPGGPEITERLHQEDFCQALGIISQHKYQNEGGPSLKQCFDLIREVSSAPVLDLQNMLDSVILNYLVGNNDAHGKNFSLTYHEGTVLTGSETRLAPLYDVLSTALYPDLSRKMAMKIGGEYDADKVIPRNFERMAEETGLAKPFVKQRVMELTQTVRSKINELPTAHQGDADVAKLILARCHGTLRQFKNDEK